MKKYINALQQTHQQVRTFQVISAGLILIILSLIAAWHFSIKSITVHIPPQIPDSGLNMDSRTIPKASVFAFTNYVWKNINDWQQDGETDYPHNLKHFAALLTPDFKNQLERTLQQQKKAGQLQHRLRLLQNLPDAKPIATRVKTVDPSHWQVTLTLRLTERLSAPPDKKTGLTQTSMPVKDVAIRYTFNVVAIDSPRSKNPWGLALAGFATQPYRVKTYV